jgi:hypothetical protein
MAVTNFSTSSIRTGGKRYRVWDQSASLTFAGGNQSAESLYALTSTMAGFNAAAVTTGGTLTINSLSVGSYDYTIKKGNQTVSSFTVGDWFNNTADTNSALIVVDGDLTINVGQTFTPSVRKLFTCLYVRGTLTVNGVLSMSQRGANHSATTAQNLRIITGTYSSVTNPQIPSSGGAGGNAVSNTAGGNTGTAGSAGGTGGGGGGASAFSNTSGAGATGTSYSGGSGGGASGNAAGATAGGANGGAGGNGTQAASDGGGGGAGNPGGAAGGSFGAQPGAAGTGGALIIFCNTFAGSGSVTAAGAAGGNSGGGSGAGGGGSGGGSITIVTGTNNGPTPTAAGGAAGSAWQTGGAGGAGTARVLTGLTI